MAAILKDVVSKNDHASWLLFSARCPSKGGRNWLLASSVNRPLYAEADPQVSAGPRRKGKKASKDAMAKFAVCRRSLRRVTSRGLFV